MLRRAFYHAQDKLLAAARVYCVTANHKRYVTDICEAAGSRCVVLGDVSDPWHSELPVYAACAKQLKPLVEAALQRDAKDLLGGGGST